MNIEAVTAPEPTPAESPDWTRWIKGTRAFDDAYASGARCPRNPRGVPCLCVHPQDHLCRIWFRLVEIAGKVEQAQIIMAILGPGNWWEDKDEQGR